MVAQNSGQGDLVLHTGESHLERQGNEWSYISPGEVRELGMPKKDAGQTAGFIAMGLLLGPGFYVGAALREAEIKSSLKKSSEKMVGGEIIVEVGGSAGGFIPFRGPAFSGPGIDGVQIYVPYILDGAHHVGSFNIEQTRDYAEFSDLKK